MYSNFVTNIQPRTFGFSSVTTSTTALTYTQLPSIICDEVVFISGPTTNAVPVLCATSSTPSNNFIKVIGLYAATGAPTVAQIVIPTGPTRNANALFVTNESGVNALIIGFMWRAYDNNMAPPITGRGSAG